MTCPTGKSPFLTKPDAEKAAKRSRQRTEVGLAPYRCQVCHEWHVGNTAGRVKAPVKTIFSHHIWRLA